MRVSSTLKLACGTFLISGLMVLGGCGGSGAGPASGVPAQVLFTDMYVQCWDGPMGTAPTDVSPGLLDMGLQVAAATDAQYPIDFCVTHVGVITH